jgi:hypothetical protein
VAGRMKSPKGRGLRRPSLRTNRATRVLEHQVEKRALLKNAPINQRNQTIKSMLVFQEVDVYRARAGAVLPASSR